MTKRAFTAFLAFALLLAACAAGEVIVLGGNAPTRLEMGVETEVNEELMMTVGGLALTRPLGDFLHVRAAIEVSLENWALEDIDIAPLVTARAVYQDAYEFTFARADEGEIWVEPLMTGKVRLEALLPNAFFFAPDAAQEAKIVLTVNETPYSLPTDAQQVQDERVSPMASAGHRHTGLLKDDGTFWTWGKNEFGQIGNGTYDDQRTPVKVMDGVRYIVMSANSTYAVRLDATLWAWGANGVGQLGDGTNENRSAPVKIMDDVAAVSAGYDHALALKTDGSLWTWGYNNYGQLGDQTTENRATPVKIRDGVLGIGCGASCAYALDADGNLFGWGQNENGQTMGGISADSGPIFANVAQAGAEETQAHALLRDGTLWGWGSNKYGSIGDGTTINRAKPVQVMSDVKLISSGASVLAVKTDGTLWAWGYNKSGSVGDNSTTNRAKPVQVLSNVLTAAAGIEYGHCAAICADGSVYTWGYNSHGQLGNGNTTNVKTPTKIGISAFAQS